MSKTQLYKEIELMEKLIEAVTPEDNDQEMCDKCNNAECSCENPLKEDVGKDCSNCGAHDQDDSVCSECGEYLGHDDNLEESSDRQYTIVKDRGKRSTEITQTVPEFLKYFSYTLETGKSYEHEKGNSKINLRPKNIKSLISNLNAAANNSAANGNSNVYYYLKGPEEDEDWLEEGTVWDLEKINLAATRQAKSFLSKNSDLSHFLNNMEYLLLQFDKLNGNNS